MLLSRMGQIVSYTLNDLKALRTQVVHQREELYGAIANLDAAGKLTDETVHPQWDAMDQRVADWLSDEPSWLRSDGQYRAGKAIQTDLLPWYGRLRELGATELSPAPTEPTKGLVSPSGLNLASLFDGGSIGGLLLIVGLAYVLGKKGSA